MGTRESQAVFPYAFLVTFGDEADSRTSKIGINAFVCWMDESRGINGRPKRVLSRFL